MNECQRRIWRLLSRQQQVKAETEPAAEKLYEYVSNTSIPYTMVNVLYNNIDILNKYDRTELLGVFGIFIIS
jgi:hypothetical protein